MVLGLASLAIGVGAMCFADRGEGEPAAWRFRALGRKRREISVTPVIGPSGGGAMVSFDW